MMHVRQTPYVNRPMVRGGPTMVDGPPDALIPALFALAGVTSDAETAAIVATVPIELRPSMVGFMAGRRVFRDAVMACVLRMVDRDALEAEIGELRTLSLYRVYL